MDYLDILTKSVGKEKPNKHYDNNVLEAKFYNSVYSGKNQDDILTNYRLKESDNQKAQRKRITKTRTKHVAKQIENILDQLRTLDKAAKVIEGKGKEQDLKDYIYNNNIEKLAFEFVKYYNLTDANAYLVCGVNEHDDIIFTPVECKNIYEPLIINDNLRFLIIDRIDRIDSVNVKSFTLYSENLIIELENSKTKRFTEGEKVSIKTETYFIHQTVTKLCYAFRLGYRKNIATNLETSTSILDSASELFTQLIWEGSELDVIKATHGIVQKFVHAPNCTFQTNEINTETNETTHYQCSEGILIGNGPSKPCTSCKGSGLRIHTSSQDIIYIPEPRDPSNSLALDKLVHIEYIPDSILQFRKDDVKELEEKIVKTVFNSNYLTKETNAKTATGERIDQQGLYSALGMLGTHVSDCFIWMCECIMDIKQISDVTVHHGYSLDLKLDTIESLIDKRGKAVTAGAPIEVIQVIDYAILQKQHVDNPRALDKIAVWEQYRPFADKSENERQSIIATLDRYDPFRILYVYFGSIKSKVTSANDGFFELDTVKQRALIDAEVNAIADQLRTSDVPERIDYSTV